MFCSRPYVYQTYVKEASRSCSSPQHQSHRDVQRRSWDFHVLNLPTNTLTHITQKMHYVNHINLYTQHIHTSYISIVSPGYIQEYTVIYSIYTVHPGQTCTSPRSTGSSELPSFTWSMLIWPTEKYFAWLHRLVALKPPNWWIHLPKFFGKIHHFRNMKELPPT